MTAQSPLETGFLASLFSETIYLVDVTSEVEQTPTIASKIENAEKKKTTEEDQQTVINAKPVIISEPVPSEKIKIPTVDITPATVINNPVNTSADAPIKYLGNNGQSVLILTEDSEHTYLSDTDALLLSKILTAVGLTMNDVAVVNMASYKTLDWLKLRNEVKYRYMIAFTPSATSLHKNLQVPLYTIKRASTLDFLIADTLSAIEQNIELKKKLWGILKGFLVSR